MPPMRPLRIVLDLLFAVSIAALATIVLADRASRPRLLTFDSSGKLPDAGKLIVEWQAAIAGAALAAAKEKPEPDYDGRIWEWQIADAKRISAAGRADADNLRIAIARGEPTDWIVDRLVRHDLEWKELVGRLIR